MANGRRLFLLDDDADLRDAVTDVVEMCGGRCLALASVAAMERAADEVLACDLAILDVNLGEGQPTGVDAFAWLAQRGYPGRVVFLTGHARSHPAVARAATLGARVLAKPIESADLRQLLDER